MKLVIATAVLLASGPCALAQVVPEAENTEYVPAGEVQYYARSASFDAYRVRSTRMNLAKRTDGSWAGLFGDQPVDVSVTPDSIRGVNITLAIHEADDNGFVITGQWQGRIVRFEMKRESMLVRTPIESLTLGRRDATSYGPNGELQLRGEAGDHPLHWPQMAFALISIFN